MRVLPFLLAISFLSMTAGAQEFKLKLEKTTDKYGLKLKKDSPQISSLKSQTNLEAKLKGFQLGKGLDNNLKDRRVAPGTGAKGWYVIPNTSSIARIPNALPYFVVPDVAAIPNPLLRNRKGAFNTYPLD